MKVRNLFLFATAIILLNSCKKNKKDDTNNSVAEVADVRTEGSTKLIALPVSTGSETVIAITLKAVGNSNMHVKIALDTLGIGALGLKKMRDGSYTIATLEYDIAANASVIVPIVIDKNQVSVDTTYGIRFRIETTTGGLISADASSIIVRIGMRNRWDGRYRVTGSMMDLFQPGVNVFVEHETYLVTTSATQVKMIPKLLGMPGYIMQNGINLTFYGNFGPVMNFDPTTNNVTSVVNFYGQPSPSQTRSAELDPSGLNKWDPATKNVTIKYWMNSTDISPHHTAFNNVWVYLGPR